MDLNEIVPMLSSAVMIAFALDVFRRFARRPTHTHLLVWGIGLAMFALGTVSEIILNLTWSEVAFRSWYLFGAILTAAWIGQGTLYLLVRRPWVKIVTIVLTVASFGVAIWLWATPIVASGFHLGTPISLQYGDILLKGVPVRLSTIPFNIYGTVTLVGGALWSGYLFWRKRVLPNRVIGNVLIAAGALSVATASTLARLGNGSFLFVGELFAALLMYAGFVLASQPAAVEGKTPQGQAVQAE
ncbi:MAG: hypothetical protein HZB51_19665 [Chloroflexi bacterium]|nr:hypothetical protein [Chloroflexota bacterium]